MNDLEPWMRFALAVLATWRVTHLLGREDGPFDLVVRLRLRLGAGFAGKLLDCFYCLSLWIAAPLSLLVSRKLVDLVLAWLAMSAAACLLERIGGDQVVIQQLSQPQEVESYGMLRTEESSMDGYHVDDPNESGSAGGPA
jgi:Protein of unknown function (DUF1360)